MSENLAKTDFYGRDFVISPDVLIPRPETEQMIDMVLALSGRAYLPGMVAPPRTLPEKPVILDVGTGSGCIAVTLALEMLEAEVYALDISEPALDVARKNAKRLGAGVQFLQSDLLSGYDGPEPDVICANLPYVDAGWDWIDKEALSHEPELALYSDDGGMACVKRLVAELAQASFSRRCAGYDRARARLARDDGPSRRVRGKDAQPIQQLILEADPCQHDDIIEYAEQHGFRHAETRGFILRFIRNKRQG